MPLAKWLLDQRFALACQLLRVTNETIEEISTLVAYRHIGAFSHAFGARYGMTPTKWRKVFGGSSISSIRDATINNRPLQPVRVVARS